MLTFKSFSHPAILSIPKSVSLLSKQPFLLSSSSPLKPSITQSRFHLFALNNQESRDPNHQKPANELKGSNNGEGGENGNSSGDNLKNDGKPLFNIKWSDLLFDPDPDNLVAVGLTGLLAWASVQVLWQLFFISSAILVAALKYSFIAALLIFILITLL